MLPVANDPAFGERLKALIGEAGYRSQRQFALTGLGWPQDSGAQRLSNYVQGRVPNIKTADLMAKALNVSVMRLYGLDGISMEADSSLISILRYLLSLEGIEPDKADTIASASLAAQRLLQRLPDDDPLPTRVKYAASAAWYQRQTPEIDTRP